MWLTLKEGNIGVIAIHQPSNNLTQEKKKKKKGGEREGERVQLSWIIYPVLPRVYLNKCHKKHFFSGQHNHKHLKSPNPQKQNIYQNTNFLWNNKQIGYPELICTTATITEDQLGQPDQESM